MKCDKCETFINTYIPLKSQAMMHRDPARYVMGAGGYGTGKTTWDIMDQEKHIFITKNGRSLLGAPTMPQLRPTIKKEFEDDMPQDFVSHLSKNDNLIRFVNNHELIYRSFDDPHKLRSLNLSRFSMLEGSGSKHSVFTQLQNRLRNMAAAIQRTDKFGNPMFKKLPNGQMIPDIIADWRKGVIETNPDPGWVKSQFLEASGTVYLHGNTPDEEYRYHDVNPEMSTHIVPTNANYNLPPNWIEEQSAGKPAWWVKRYFGGSFSYAEGLVYPNFMSTIVDGFEIPKNWKRLIAMDYGINDNTHFVFIALDRHTHTAYVYDELVISDSNVKQIVRVYRKKLHPIPLGALYCTPVMDQRSMSKRQSHDTNKTLGTLFEDEGILFDPAQMNVDARVLRLNTLIELGQLKIFRHCTGLIKEISEYRFPEKDLDKPNKDTDKPQDKFNHGVNALEFAAMELPHNLEQLDYHVYNRSGKRIMAEDDEMLKKAAEPEFDPFKTKREKSQFPMHYGGDIDGGDYDNDPNMFDMGIYGTHGDD